MPHNAPLPPAPLVRSPGSATQTTTLVRELAALNDIAGAPVPTRVIPGDMPSVEIAPEHLVASAMYLRDQLGFDLLSCVSGVDMTDHFAIVYHLRSTITNWLLQIKVRVPPSLEVASVLGVWATANWLERETFDMYGVIFTGHPDLRRILLDDEFEGYPLRKSFRPTPLTAHDRATTQSGPQQAVDGESQRGLGEQRAITAHVGQGDQERYHPGTPTFGATQFHGREFPPQTWKHTLEAQTTEDTDGKRK